MRIGALPEFRNRMDCGALVVEGDTPCRSNRIADGRNAAAAAGNSAGAAQSEAAGPPITPGPASDTVCSVPASGERPSQIPCDSEAAIEPAGGFIPPRPPAPPAPGRVA